VDENAARRDFALLASRDGRDGSLRLQQDVDLWMARVGAGAARQRPLGTERHAWVHVARGAAMVNGVALAEGDAVAMSGEAAVDILGPAQGEAELLFFDLA
jgi:quercetin 2,3-dioxygenase